MKNHSIEDLKLRETYEADPELATLARETAEAYHMEHRDKMDVGIGDFRRETLAGRHPEMMAKAVGRIVKAEKARRTRARNAGRIAAELRTPPGYTSSVEDDRIILDGPFDQDLHRRIKRAGGRWDGQMGTNRRVWMIPVSKAQGLQRILENYASAHFMRVEDEEQVAAARARAPDVESGQHVRVHPDGDLYRVWFPYDPDAVRLIRQVPHARFARWTKEWLVDRRSGVELRGFVEAADALIGEKVAEQQRLEEEQAAAERARAPDVEPGQHVRVHPDGDHYRVRFQYDPAAVRLIRRVPHARFLVGTKEWLVDRRSGAALRKFVENADALIEKKQRLEAERQRAEEEKAAADERTGASGS